MREIKFRTYDIDTKLMSSPFTVGERVVYFKDNKIGCHLDLWTNEFKIMQFTGLKDKNGLDIYNGDIVDNGTGNYKGAITFDNGSFLHRGSPLGFYVEDGVVEDNRDDPDGKITLQVSDTSTWAIVIGNIYENPELL